MNGHGQEITAGGKYDYRAFPEKPEPAHNIGQRPGWRRTPAAGGPAAVREITDLQRYMTEMYCGMRAYDHKAPHMR